MSFTKGQGRYGKIYERLRKRSYRNFSASTFTHVAYVEGVRDALSAVEKDRREMIQTRGPRLRRSSPDLFDQGRQPLGNGGVCILP